MNRIELMKELEAYDKVYKTFVPDQFIHYIKNKYQDNDLIRFIQLCKLFMEYCAYMDIQYTKELMKLGE